VVNATDRRTGTFKFNPYLEDSGLTLAYGSHIFGSNLLRENIKYQRHTDGLKHKYFTPISDRI